MTESTLHDYLGGDRDSRGLYQQRPSQGWGTADQVVDPTYATNKFLSVMQRYYPNGAWTTGDIGAIAQRVQVSAVPDAYDKEAAAAQLVVNALGSGTPPPPSMGASSTSYTGAVAGDYNDSVVLSARLVDSSTSAGLSGRSVAFTLGTQSCSGTTDGSGDASCSVTLAQTPGSYTVKASFGGDASYTASADSKPFTIRKKATKTSYKGPGAADYYDAFTASATLTDAASSVPIAGKTITLTLGATDSCSGVTDASGSVACSITPTQPAGVYSLVASFGSDSLYLASSDTSPFTIKREETVTTLTAKPANSSKFGQPVTFTAVSAADPPGGAPAPTGSTAFVVDGTPVGSTGVPGSASIATASLRAGSHTIAATYSGDQNFLPSSGGLPYTVTCDVNISGTHNGALIVTTTTCLADGTHVNGAVIVKPGGALDVESSTIKGAIGATKGAGVIRVCGSSIAGAVDVKNSGALVLIGPGGDPSCAPNQIGGALDVKNNTHGAQANGNQVGGATLTSGNSGPGAYAVANGVPGGQNHAGTPLTQTKELAAAIKACGKLKHAKQRTCIAAATKRHTQPNHKPQTKRRLRHG